MVDEVSENIVAELSKRGIFGGFSEQKMYQLHEGMLNTVDYDLKDSQKNGRSIRVILLLKKSAKWDEWKEF